MHAKLLDLTGYVLDELDHASKGSRVLDPRERSRKGEAVAGGEEC